ncbi:MAG: TetR/AcrR family transcriptional regulator [Solirubrobacterales bacterium]
MGTLSADTEVLSVSDRDRILQAMAECCAERGYAATTVGAVLERAGVGTESFESYFAGKEDCALAALNKIVSETLARIAMANPLAGDEVQRRKFEIKAILELMAGEPAFAWLAYVESRQGGTPRMHDAYESAARVLALMMERVGVAAGGRNGLARASLGGAEAVVRRELAAGRAGRLPELLKDFVYAALVPFVGQREALRQAKEAARVAAEKG